MKRILTVQDISCVGKCSLTVALPIISAMGIEACVLPTAVLSTHTAFKGFTFRDLTCDLEGIYKHWESQKIHFDAIYTGYLGSIEQISIICDLIDRFGTNDTIIIVDPCMGDNGKLYSGFTKEYAKKMLELCKKAHVILPNLTEACYLLEKPYPESSYTTEYIEEVLKGLSDFGVNRIVLKGVEFNSDTAEIKGVSKRMGIASYDRQKDSIKWYFHQKHGQSFHGTGDIFASVFTGALVRGLSFEKSYSLAGDFVVEAIKNTLSHPDYNWYGVDFESAIPYLVSRL